MSDTAAIRVLLVEDNEVYRSSLELLLGMVDGIEVVGAIADGTTVSEAVAATEPRVVLMDYRLPGTDGARATAALRRSAPKVAVVCLTAEITDAERQLVLDAGAFALVEKAEPIQQLVETIRGAAVGA